MCFELSFSAEFFMSEGEPYDGPPTYPVEYPQSVWSAICSMSKDDWGAMCGDCFPDVDPEYIGPESVLELIERTNTCTDLRTPVEVWIDEGGYHTVSVWDRTSLEDAE